MQTRGLVVRVSSPNRRRHPKTISKARGREPVLPQERFVKRCVVRKPSLKRAFSRANAVCEQAPGALEPELDDVLVHRYAGLGVEAPHEMCFSHVQRSGDGFRPQVVLQMRGEIGLRAAKKRAGSSALLPQAQELDKEQANVVRVNGVVPRKRRKVLLHSFLLAVEQREQLQDGGGACVRRVQLQRFVPVLGGDARKQLRQDPEHRALIGALFVEKPQRMRAAGREQQERIWREQNRAILNEEFGVSAEKEIQFVELVVVPVDAPKVILRIGIQLKSVWQARGSNGISKIASHGGIVSE
ncbi:hypothetical protein SDC9_106914 [bioreactor metagenome]|uniref:Uncharacterized protein n=1 Tax=bioreactor metagenome TaxID=1076179 RepID=A0A645B3T2_9ZZZZ